MYCDVAMCTYAHTHTHAHLHTHTHHGQSVIHTSTSMLCYCNLLIVHPHTNKKTAFSCHPIHHMLLFVSKLLFLLEPLLFLNCFVFQCTHLCMHTHTHHTQALACTCNCSHMFIVGVNVCLCSGNFITNYQRVSCCLLHF